MGHKSASFVTLGSGELSPLNIIFVLGQQQDNKIQIREWRKFLQQQDISESTKKVSIHIFAFRASTLLKGGDDKLVALSKDLQKRTTKILEEDPKRELILFVYELAELVVKKALASFNSLATSNNVIKVKGILFCEAPRIETDEDWQLLNQKSVTKSRNSNTTAVIPFNVVAGMRENFDLLAKHEHFHPMVAYFKPEASAQQDIQLVSSRNRVASVLSVPPWGSYKTDSKSPRQFLQNDLKAEIIKQFRAVNDSGNIVKASERENLHRIESVPSTKKDKLDRNLSHHKTVQIPAHKLGQQPQTSVEPRDTALSSSSRTSRKVNSPDVATSPRETSFSPPEPKTPQSVRNAAISDSVEMRRQGAAFLSRGEHRQAMSIYAEICRNLEVENPDRRQVCQRKDLPSDIFTAIKFEWAELLFGDGEFSKAISVFAELKDQSSGNDLRGFEIRVYIAKILDAMGKYQKAYELLERLQTEIMDSWPFDRHSVQQKHPMHEWSEANKLRIFADNVRSLNMAHVGMFEEAIAVSNAIMEEYIIKQQRRDKPKLTEDGQGINRIYLRAKDESENGDQLNYNTVQTSTEPRFTSSLNEDEKEQAIFLQGICTTRSQILWLSGYRKDARILNDEVLRDTKELLGAKHTLSLENRILQAELLLASGKVYDAEKCCRETLSDLRLSHGKLHPLTLYAYECEVSIVTAQGRLTEARNRAKALISWSNEKLGSEHPQTLRARRKLALIHAARGEFKDAMALQILIKDAISAFGTTHMFTLQLQADLTTIYYLSGDINVAGEQAFETLQGLHRKFDLSALSFRPAAEQTTSHGFQNIETYILSPLQGKGFLDLDCQPYTECLLQILQCLGVCESERVSGDLSLAAKLLQPVCAKRKDRLLSEKPDIDTLSCMHHLAVMLRKNNQPKAALEYLDEVLEEWTIMLGHSQQQTLLARFERNFVCFNLCEEVSIIEQREILHQVTELLGDSHPDTNAMRSDLSLMLHKMGYLEEAEKEQLKALYHQISRSLRPSSLAPTTTASNSFAERETVFSIFEKIANENQHPSFSPCSQVLTSIERLVEVEWDKGNYDNGIIAQKALLSLGQVWGFTLEKTLNAMHNLGYLYQTYADTFEEASSPSNFYELAIEAYQGVIEKLGTHTLPDKQLLLATQINYGSVHYKKRNFLAARVIQNQIIDTIEADERLKNSPTHVANIYNLALTEKASNNCSKSQELLEMALEMSKGIPEPDSSIIRSLLVATKA